MQSRRGEGVVQERYYVGEFFNLIVFQFTARIQDSMQSFNPTFIRVDYVKCRRVVQYSLNHSNTGRISSLIKIPGL